MLSSMFLIIQVSEAFAGGTSELQLVSSNTFPVPTNGSAKVHMTLGPRAAAALPAKQRFTRELPMDGEDYGQYLAILNVVTGATVTAGKLDAWLSFNKIDWKATPEAPS